MNRAIVVLKKVLAITTGWGNITFMDKDRDLYPISKRSYYWDGCRLW